MARTPEEYAHLEWIGYVQPVGLIVSAPALLEAQCYVNKNIATEHARFLSCLPCDAKDNVVPRLDDFSAFATKCLGWEADDLQEIPARGELTGDMAVLEVILPQYQETLRPTHAVPSFKPGEGESPWQLLLQWLPAGTSLDEPSEADNARHWQAAPQLKFERLLRESGVPIGILGNGEQLRLVYAPRGESSGYATFNVAEMVQVAGRPIFAALHMLLSADRMFTLSDDQRLPAILENSRKYQSNVSTKLAEQVLAALYELIRGFQSANDARQGELLRQVLEENPNQVYSGLLTVLMRLVFVMYAEDRNLVSDDPLYANHYSVTGLFERLREEAGRFPDTMDSRYGGWSQLITLFRLIYEGGQHADFKLPPRKGYLFDPERYPFLEGWAEKADEAAQPSVPRISDGVVFRVLQNLLILDGERLSYRTLDVEQIGSVYETVMGFNLETAAGKSIAIKPAKPHGAPATINLEALLAKPGKDRAKTLKDESDQTLSGDALTKLKDAASIAELLDALDKKIHKVVTPSVVPDGAMVLQPSDERRRSGSHYTPRSLTEPIVRTTLEPILKQLCDQDAEPPTVWSPSAEDKKRFTKGEIDLRIQASQRRVEYADAARAVGSPHPQQILDLKVCDPAMGSGAFLVETCRQLGDELIKAWYAHDAVPTDIPPDEDEVLYARRLVAQRCLYGVDKNVMAVDLAKLSLWLVTLARDHAFTFLDHSLRHGDSLVGLTREQIIGFHWEPKKQKQFGGDLIQKRLDRATEARAKILNAREDVPYRDQQQRMASADEALDLIRLVGDACVSGFFAGQKKKEREEHAERLFGVASSYLESLTAGRGKQVDFESRRVLGQAAARLRAGSHPIPAFHWEIEFPEVFARENGGFDAFVGNPPFLGGPQLSRAFGGAGYQEWLKAINERAFGNADLSAYFFRLAFSLVRTTGTFGFLATNSISEGGTRKSGLQAILALGGIIFEAKRSLRWPGEAAVFVAVVHVAATLRAFRGHCTLDNKNVQAINSRLLPSAELPDPEPLRANDLLSFMGAGIGGAGFILEPTEHQELARSSKNQQCLMPYLNGEQVNGSPTQTHEKYAINFGSHSLDYAQGYPELLEIVRDRVKPDRDRQKDHGPGKHGKKYWWQFVLRADPLYRAIVQLDRCLVAAISSPQLSFSFQPTRQVFSHALVVFAFETYAPFACLQSRVHFLWAKLLSSSLKEDLRYSVSDAFQTFPFPEAFNSNAALEQAGRDYYNFRAELMISNNEGLTRTYNRFHSPDERDEGILELRRLHGLMDGAVLRAYGWDDLAESARCEFLLDYEEEEDDADAGPPAAGARKKSKKKKPWRLRWPDNFRDEVLARLLELNEQRHQEEVRAGVTADAAQSDGAAAKKTKRSKKKAENLLFGDDEETA
jgi:hypothetical protein